MKLCDLVRPAVGETNHYVSSPDGVSLIREVQRYWEDHRARLTSPHFRIERACRPHMVCGAPTHADVLIAAQSSSWVPLTTLPRCVVCCVCVCEEV